MAIGKILCLGDSLTAGLEWSATGYRSYRGPLQKLLSDAGYTVDFVGTVSDPPASGGTDPDHNGYGGARMDSSDSADNSIEGRVSTIRAAVGPVDIIILMIGWNDVYSATASVATPPPIRTPRFCFRVIRYPLPSRCDWTAHAPRPA